MTSLLKSLALIYLGWYIAKRGVPGEAEITTLISTNKKLLAELQS